MITSLNAQSICRSMTNGNALQKIKEYCLLMRIFQNQVITGSVPAVSNLDFQELFSDFFQFPGPRRTRTMPLYSGFFRIIDDLVIDPSHRNMNYVLTELEKISHEKHVSFSSKMLHLFNPDLPIWDSMVIPNKKHTKTGAQIPQHFADPYYGGIINHSFPNVVDAVAEYNKYVVAFNNYKNGVTPPLPGEIDGATIINMFRHDMSTIPSLPRTCLSLSEISDTKALDFVIWSDRIPGTRIRTSFKSSVVPVMRRHGI